MPASTLDRILVNRFSGRGGSDAPRWVQELDPDYCLYRVKARPYSDGQRCRNDGARDGRLVSARLRHPVRKGRGRVRSRIATRIISLVGTLEFPTIGANVSRSTGPLSEHSCAIAPSTPSGLREPIGLRSSYGIAPDATRGYGRGAMRSNE